MRYEGSNQDPDKEQSEPSVFGLNIKGVRHKGRKRAPSSEKLGAGVAAAQRADSLRMAILRIENRKREEDERMAMHGPVRVLWKDGKPCGKEIL
jgi:hypothetical protein